MDKKSKILITTFFIFLFLSFVAIYYNDMILRDFEIIESSQE